MACLAGLKTARLVNAATAAGLAASLDELESGAPVHALVLDAHLDLVEVVVLGVEDGVFERLFVETTTRDHLQGTVDLAMLAGPIDLASPLTS